MIAVWSAQFIKIKEPSRLSQWRLSDQMNALPLKPRASLRDHIDELIADYGVRPVLLAIAARIVKRSRPPDTLDAPDLGKQPGIDRLDNRLRADIGLAPLGPSRSHLDLGVMFKRDLF